MSTYLLIGKFYNVWRFGNTPPYEIRVLGVSGDKLEAIARLSKLFESGNADPKNKLFCGNKLWEQSMLYVEHWDNSNAKPIETVIVRPAPSWTEEVAS